MNLKLYLSTLRNKGYLAYEYNPFHNYQTNVDLYKVYLEGQPNNDSEEQSNNNSEESNDTSSENLKNESFIVPKGKAVNTKNGEILSFYKTEDNINYYKDKEENIYKVSEFEFIKEWSNGTPWAQAGSLIDFDTDQLNFDLDHPVDIEVQPSYDGSVNLILNDDKNIPRLINSRFSVREKGTYEIVDRIGENDTNIYNSQTFDKDTSLYFQYEYNPTIKYIGQIKGNLSVGSYCFYFTYCDADDNESDYIAETGIIPVFIGSDGDPFSIDGGIKNQNSNKGVRLKLTNLDKSYNYLKIYYVRYFADYQQNRVYECKKIYQKYPINSSTLYLQITGNENAEDLDANILNITRFNPQSILTQAQCKNMLFFGNIVKNTDNYKELQDCALRIIPKLNIQKMNQSNIEYSDGGYFDSQNMYNSVGYFNQEYYRFGVVFIYQNGTLSNVYNTLGTDLVKENDELEYRGSLYSEDGAFLKRNYITIDDYGWVKDASLTFDGGINLNARGVCKINTSEVDDMEKIIGIKFNIPKEVITHLKEDLGIRGLFFVRQKCVPNILAQCYLLRMDELLEAPVISYGEGSNKKYVTECFLNKDTGEVVNNYESRLYEYKNSDKDSSLSEYAYAGICPDFLLNQPYYNQIFNGAKFNLQKISVSGAALDRNGRNYKTSDNITLTNANEKTRVIICSVTDDVSSVALKDKVYKLEMGETEESFRFKYAEVDTGTYNAGEEKKDKNSYNLVRGKYSPYLAIYSNTKLDDNELYNIYQEGIESTSTEYQIRMDSSEPFYAISDRYNFEQLIGNDDKSLVCWRGDCFINNFTYRLNRNFNDPTLPNNDQIVDKNTWKDNYDPQNTDKWEDISRSDLNAVQMGSWITFKVRSAMNYALRSQDHSYVSEEALMGAPRSYYPRSQMMWRGANKMPDSYLYNDAYRASLGFKCYFTLKDINYIKDTFSNRIQYSAISVQDSYKNNYRYSLSTYFRDYSAEYGGITKLVSFEGYLLVVFEHAIGVAVINERILAGQGDGEPVFINTKNVLPEELTIISDTLGSQWSESIVKSEVGYVYGVDTVQKKIWRVKGQQIEVLSDFKVNKFLVDNISLGERETNPIIGLKNVKTHYNNNKKDVMFTFYDDIYKDQEKVWNLCFNEMLDIFVTFYSWVPSYSANIDNQYFSFNRNTSKVLTLAGKCNWNISSNNGILIDSPLVKDITSYEGILHYRENNKSVTLLRDDGTTSEMIIDVNADDISFEFELEHDHWGNWKYFELDQNDSSILRIKSEVDTEKLFKNKYVLLQIKACCLKNNIKYSVKSETISLISSECLKPTIEAKDGDVLTSDFYLHGQAGLIDVQENTYPCRWYDEWHPFEFEVVVNDKVGEQKVFTNLIIIGNKAEPESFHFEIEGDNYDFSQDKRTMYYRQEETKQLFQDMGSDILYDLDYTDIKADKYTQEQYYNGNPWRKDNNDEYVITSEYTDQYNDPSKGVYPVQSIGLVKQEKSTIFPLYYSKIDTYNDIYHKYQLMMGDGYDFQNLSGSEVVWNRKLNQFDIVSHIKNSPINRVGRTRGNSFYNEGKWQIQIPSISFMQKNENNWIDNKPPIVLTYLPEDIKDSSLPVGYSVGNIPNTYLPIYNGLQQQETKYITNQDGWTNRKETKIRDKWMKVRVRYSGKNLAVIHSLVTLFNISSS